MARKRTEKSPGKNQQAGDLEKAVQSLRAHCGENALRFTGERVEVLQAILDADGHFDPDQLLDLVRQRGIRLSRATLYRTLGLLEEAGIIGQVLPGHRHRHYEYVLGRPEHDHIVEAKTGRVIEFDSAEVTHLCQTICRRHGLRAVGHRLQIAADSGERGNDRKKSRA